jgi:replicative DNA helicase
MDAEKAVLGSLLIDSDFLPEVSNILRPADFYADAHRKIFETMLAMDVAGQPLDGLTLVERIRQDGNLEAVGDVAYIADVAQSVPVAEHAEYYSRIVREKSILRGIIHATTKTLQDAYVANDQPEEILSRATAALAEIESGASTEIEPIRPMVAEAMTRIYESRNRHQGGGLFTGLEKFDTYFGGLFPGELIILAGRTREGKTSLACQIAHHNASEGRAVLFVSLEMRGVELVTRILCTQAGISNQTIRAGKLSDNDVDELSKASGPLAEAPFYILDTPKMRVSDVRRAARRLRKKGLSLVVVDYIGLVTPPDARKDRHLQVGDITRELMQLAGELRVPVLALSQLNRASEDVGRPQLKHLRESGNIEQDAHMVLFVYHTDKNLGKAELEVAKQRNGETGTVKLEWIAWRTMFQCEPEPTAATMPNRERAFDQYDGHDDF